jgi:trk system potassium uptake protein TrkA
MSTTLQRQFVLIGLDGIGPSVFQSLPTDWHITVVDTDLNKLNAIPDVWGEYKVTKICDNASSKLVLEECDLVPSTLLTVLTTKDKLNQEVVRIAKEEFSVETIFVIQNSAEFVCSFENVTVLNAENLLTNRLSSQLRGTVSAANIGQERGEIRQITILNSSAARGQSLKEMQPKSWLVAAIYRDGALLVPHGDTIIRAGDEVVVVGEPDILDRELSYLRGGQILFPSQYGIRIGVLDGEHDPELMAQLVEHSEVVGDVTVSFESLNPELKSDAEIRNYLIENDVGMVFLPPKPISWLARWGFRTSKIMNLMFKSQIPFWVNNDTDAIRKILVCISEPKAMSVIGSVAMDVARQFNAELTLLNVIPPNIDQEERRIIEQIPTELQRLANTHGLPLQKRQSEGNPIREIIAHAKDFDLLIVGYSEHTRSTIANPDISLHLFHEIRTCPNTSILFVPWQTPGR